METRKEAVDKFLQFELNNNLFERHINGFCYWMYIRNELFEDIFLSTSETGNREKKIPYSVENVEEVQRFSIVSLLRKFSKSPMLKKNKGDLLFFQDHTIYNEQENCYESKETPPIIDYYIHRSVIVSIGNIRKPIPRARYERNRYVYLPSLLTSLEYNLRRKLRLLNRLKKKIRNNISDWMETINEIQGVCIDIDEYVNKILYYYIAWKKYGKYFSYFLKKSEISLIFEVCYYSFEKMILNEVAHDMEIPIIELQHGAIGQTEIAYNILRKNMDHLPDYFFIYADFWRRYTRLPYGDEQIKCVGSWYLEDRINKYRGISKGSKNVILFIGQDDENFVDYAIECARYIADNQLDATYAVWYRLHPTYVASYNSIKDRISKYSKIIRIIKPNEMNIFKCFSQASTQVTRHSTAVYEGLKFGLQTFIVKSEYIESVMPLIDMGYAKILNRIEDLFTPCSFIQDAIGVYADNPKKRVIDEIEKILAASES